MLLESDEPWEEVGERRLKSSHRDSLCSVSSLYRVERRFLAGCPDAD